MPTVRVRTPDGSTVTVNAPAGATDAQILAFAKQQYEQNTQAQQAFREQVDVTPTEPPAPFPRGLAFQGIGMLQGKGTQEAPTEQLKLENAAARGVDIQTGAPASIRAKAGLLGSDPEAASLARAHRPPYPILMD